MTARAPAPGPSEEAKRLGGSKLAVEAKTEHDTTEAQEDRVEVLLLIMTIIIVVRMTKATW